MTDRETGAGFHVGGETVQTYNDAHYKKLRERWGLGDDFLATFDFTKNMKGGGGKGGDLMGFTTDKLYIVKEVNPGDQKTLLKITEDYAQHLLDPHGSLLARFFLHFSRKGKDFLVMNNWMPPPRYDAVDSMEELGFDLKTNYNRFDLKGCADDKTLVALGEPVHAVHKRIFNVGMWCGDALWTPERKRYFEGKKHAQEVKFHVSQQVHDEISKQTRRDVQFLQKWGLMDYSLVVSYHGVPRTHLDVARSVYAGTSDGGSQPYLAASKDTLYISYVGIIDFLQDWTCAKKVAMCVKCCECNKATIPPVFSRVLFFNGRRGDGVGRSALPSRVSYPTVRHRRDVPLPARATACPFRAIDGGLTGRREHRFRTATASRPSSTPSSVATARPCPRSLRWTRRPRSNKSSNYTARGFWRVRFWRHDGVRRVARRSIYARVALRDQVPHHQRREVDLVPVPVLRGGHRASRPVHLAHREAREARHRPSGLLHAVQLFLHLGVEGPPSFHAALLLQQMPSRVCWHGRLEALLQRNILDGGGGAVHAPDVEQSVSAPRAPRRGCPQVLVDLLLRERYRTAQRRRQSSMFVFAESCGSHGTTRATSRA